MPDKKAVTAMCFNTKSVENKSRLQLLNWINSKLEQKIERIEELCTGTEYCQLMNLIFPNCIDLKKVKFNCRLENDYIKNFKLLQASLDKVGIDKTIAIAQLIRGKFRDNYSFLQFFHKMFEKYYMIATTKANVDSNSSSHESVILNKLKSASEDSNEEKLDFSSEITVDGDEEEPTSELSIIEKKRDFFFTKLFQIEEICRRYVNNAVVQHITAVLYENNDA